MKKLLMATLIVTTLTLSNSALATGGGKTVDPSFFSNVYTSMLSWF